MDDLPWRRRLEVHSPDFVSLDVGDEDETGRLVDGDADGVRQVQTGSEERQVVGVRVERHDVRHTAEGDQYPRVTRLVICGRYQSTGKPHVGAMHNVICSLLMLFGIVLIVANV